jgi:GTP-binding protein
VLEQGYKRRAILADIPGLIEGAHKGIGLGDRFLRHIERTRILIHLVAVAPEAVAPERLWNDYQAVRHELAAYSETLAAKPEIVVINKIDLVESPKAQQKITAFFRKRRVPVLLISARDAKGLDKLVERLFSSLEKIAAAAAGESRDSN